MKKVVAILMIIGFIISCNPTQKTVADSTKVATKTSDTVRIANDEIEYEVIIIDPGFNSFLYGQARPRGYYSESFLEQRNRIYANEWNIRARQPSRYDSNLYEMQIDYDSNIHYGYEVNYLIYNYFIYFQIHYKQQLSGFAPRI